MSESAEPRNLEFQRALRAVSRCPAGASAGELAAAVQRTLGYVAPRSIPLIAERTGLSLDEVETVVNARADLDTAPRARHRLAICTGMTCARLGGAALVRVARRTLGVESFQTTADGGIRMEPFRCFGMCAQAPNIRIDGATRGAMTKKRFELLLGVIDRPER